MSRPRAFVQSLLVVLGFLGCARPSLPPSPHGNWAPSRESALSAPSPLDGLVLPARTGPAIGEACPPSNFAQGLGQAAAPLAPPDVCGTRGRVAIEEQSSTFGFEQGLPCDLRSTGDRNSGGPSAACVSGDHLVIVSNCVMCRRIDAGQVIHAKLSELTSPQHARLAQVIGVPPGRAPRTAEAWRALFGQGSAD